MANIGTVQSVTGIVKAIAEDGTERTLKVGDSIAENEKIITGNGVIVIALNDGNIMDLGSSTSIVLNEETLNDQGGQAAAQTPSDAQADAAAQQAALLSDPNFDPSVNLEATAAGGESGNNGSTAVNVEFLNQHTSPDSGFDTAGITTSFDTPDDELLQRFDSPPTDFDVDAVVSYIEDFDELGLTFDGEDDFGGGFVREFSAGEQAPETVHGTDPEDGTTESFTVTSLPEVGLLMVDRGDDSVVDEIYGEGYLDLPEGGFTIMSGDAIYYFLEDDSNVPNPEEVSFNYFTTDSDGLVSDGATVTIEIPDSNPEVFEQTPITVDEDGLPGGIPGDVENGDVEGVVISVNGTLNYDFGSDGAGDIDFALLDGQAVQATGDDGLQNLTANGDAVTYVWDGASHTLTGVANLGDGEGEYTVFTLVVTDTATGAYTFTLESNVDQPTADTEDDLVLDLAFTVTDIDGDTASGSVLVTIDDDAPVIDVGLAVQGDGGEGEQEQVTINFEGLEIGLEVNDYYPGITFSGAGGSFTTYDASSFDSNNPIQATLPDGRPLTVEFDEPVSNLTFDIGADNANSSYTVDIYIDGVFSETFVGPTDGDIYTIEHVDLSGYSNITKIVVTTPDYSSFGNFSYTTGAGVVLPVLATQDADTIGDASDTDMAPFASLFTLTSDMGADVGGTEPVLSYALSLGAAESSGLTSNGEEIILSIEEGIISASTSDGVIFTLTVDAETGVVELTQNAEIDHLGEAGNNSVNNLSLLAGNITLTASATIVDGDGDTASDSQALDISGSVSFDDDVPLDFSPIPLIIVNDNDGTATGGSVLDVFGNTGADGLGDAIFTGTNANDGTPLTDTSAGAITSDGKALYLYGYGTGTLQAWTHDGEGNPETLVMTITLNPDADVESNDLYTVTLHQALDDGSGGGFDDFSDTAAGLNEWVGVDGDGGDIMDDTNNSEDLLVTALGAGQINTDNDDIGVSQGQAVSPGETVRLDFVIDLQRDGVEDEKDATGYTYDNHFSASEFTAKMVDVSGSQSNTTAIAFKAFMHDDADKKDLTAGNTQINILLASVVVMDIDGVTMLTEGGEYEAFVDGGTLYVEGLLQGQTVTFDTDGNYNAMEMENVSGQINPEYNDGTLFDGSAFGLGGFEYDDTVEGSDNEMEFDVTLIDGDGDTATGTITVTGTPDDGVIEGTDGDEALVGSDANEVLIGGLGSDMLTGGAGEDVFVYAAGDGGNTVDLADLITDFTDDVDTLGLDGLVFGDANGEATFLDAETIGGTAGDTALVISDGAAGYTEVLAIIQGVSFGTLDSGDTTEVL